MKFAKFTVSAFLVLVFSCNAQAALVAFDLTRSSELGNGPAYLRVTIDDEGKAGRINFNVSLLEPLRDMAGRNFGIESFAFNSDFHIGKRNIVGLPRGWSFDSREKMGDYGRFDAQVEAKRDRARVDSLSFSIKGISWDTIWDYLDRSSGFARAGHFFFAAQVGGLNAPEDFCIVDSYFAGNTYVPQPVPLPAAAGLLLGGIGMLGAFGRRRRNEATVADTR